MENLKNLITIGAIGGYYKQNQYPQFSYKCEQTKIKFGRQIAIPKRECQKIGLPITSSPFSKSRIRILQLKRNRNTERLVVKMGTGGIALALHSRSHFCSTYGSRTRHSSVKGRRLNRLTNAPFPFWECKDKGGFLNTKTFFAYLLCYYHRLNDTEELISLQRCTAN